MAQETSPTDQMFDVDDALVRQTFLHAPEAMLLVDPEGRIVAANLAAEQLLEYPASDLVGVSIEKLVPQRFRHRHTEDRQEFLEDPVKRPMGAGRELFALTSTGREVPVEIGLSPIVTESGVITLTSVHDITDRQRLRAFSVGVLQGSEEERQRIARELHDETAQSLSALALRVQMARRTDDPERRAELLRGMYDEIRRASDGVHRVLRGLRPPALEEAGLATAVRAMVRDTFAGSDVDVALACDDVDGLLSAESRLALYRIIQEAVANALRHASASAIRISVELTDDSVRARVEDDGSGFSIQDRSGIHGRGLGTLGMQERAVIVGGSVRIESTPGEGTRVETVIPLG